METDNKEVKECTRLNAYQMESLSRLIIEALERNHRIGVVRQERITAPSGAVILF